MNDLMSRLRSLPEAEPSPSRASALQRRCRTELLRRTERAARPEAGRTRGRSLLVLQLAAASVSLVYVAEVLVLAARVLSAR